MFLAVISGKTEVQSIYNFSVVKSPGKKLEKKNPPYFKFYLRCLKNEGLDGGYQKSQIIKILAP